MKHASAGPYDIDLRPFRPRWSGFQGRQFVNVFEHPPTRPAWTRSDARAEDLLIDGAADHGATEAQELFRSRSGGRQGKGGYLRDVTCDFIGRLERQLAGSVGAATAHAMVGQLTEGCHGLGRGLIAVDD